MSLYIHEPIFKTQLVYAHHTVNNPQPPHPNMGKKTGKRERTIRSSSSREARNREKSTYVEGVALVG